MKEELYILLIKHPQLKPKCLQIGNKSEFNQYLCRFMWKMWWKLKWTKEKKNFVKEKVFPHFHFSRLGICIINFFGCFLSMLTAWLAAWFHNQHNCALLFSVIFELDRKTEILWYFFLFKFISLLIYLYIALCYMKVEEKR